MRPFFRHYGGKWRLSGMTEPPRYPRIIEPFAGAAGYSVRYGAGLMVDLFDLSPDVCAIWDWLLGASQADVLALPVEPLHAGADVRELGLDRAPMLLVQRWLTTQGSTSNWRMTPMVMEYSADKPGSCWSQVTRARIAAQLPDIARWTITHGSHDAAPDVPATWHIDPPYQHNASAPSAYGTPPVDYAALGAWCRTRRGHVMVHEQEGADWLPFWRMKADAAGWRVALGRLSRCCEVWWTHGETQVVLPW